MQSRYLNGLTIRALRDGDTETVAALFARLGERSRERRFCGAKPRLSDVELATLARNAQIVAGVDTGLTHLSAALGTPTVALFTATDARLAGVSRAGPHALDLGGNGRVPTPADAIEAAGRVLRDTPRC